MISGPGTVSRKERSSRCSHAILVSVWAIRLGEEQQRNFSAHRDLFGKENFREAILPIDVAKAIPPRDVHNDIARVNESQSGVNARRGAILGKKRHGPKVLWAVITVPPSCTVADDADIAVCRLEDLLTLLQSVIEYDDFAMAYPAGQ